MYAVHVNLNRNGERLLRKCVHRVRELKHTAKLWSHDKFRRIYTYAVASTVQIYLLIHGRTCSFRIKYVNLYVY